MDCFFHSNVPSVAPCGDCGKPICATCRDQNGYCPSCRLAAKIDAAAATRQTLAGEVPPRQHQHWRTDWQPQAQQPAPQARIRVDDLPDPIESRALVALGYPLWPVALLSLLDPKHSRRLRRQAYQALGFNVGMAGLYGLLTLLTNIPILNISAFVLLGFILPVFIVLSVFYGIKVWHGDDVRVPIIGDWLEERLPA